MLAHLFFICRVTPVRNNTNSKQSSKGNPHQFQNDAVSVKRKTDTSQSADQRRHASTTEG